MKYDRKLKCSIDYLSIYEKYLISESKDLKMYINMIYGMQNHPRNNVKFNFNLKNLIFTYLNEFYGKFEQLDINKYLVYSNLDIFYFVYPGFYKLHENKILESYFHKSFKVELIHKFIYFGHNKYIEFKDNDFYVSNFYGIKGIKKI